MRVAKEVTLSSGTRATQTDTDSILLIDIALRTRLRWRGGPAKTYVITRPLSPGEIDTLRVVVESQNGRSVNPLVLQWASSDQSVARVSLAGVVTAVGPGKATLTVSGLLQSKSIEVSVHPVVDKLSVRPRLTPRPRLCLTDARHA